MRLVSCADTQKKKKQERRLLFRRGKKRKLKIRMPSPRKHRKKKYEKNNIKDQVYDQ